jgi:nickel/cobalt transporter (NicO) family protein
MYKFLEWLRYFDQTIQQAIRDLNADFNLIIWAGLMLAAFVYGVLHSLGPGHGKSLVVSFFLKEKSSFKKPVLMAALIAFVHSVMAIILALLLYFVLTQIKGIMRIQMQSYFMAVSGTLIMAIAIVFFTIRYFKKFHNKNQAGSGSLTTVAIAAGLVPCPAALTIMLYTLANQAVFIGLSAVAGISAGMFTLLAVIGMFSVKSRQGILKISGRFGTAETKVASILEYVAIAFIFLIGLSMSADFYLRLLR